MKITKSELKEMIREALREELSKSTKVDTDVDDEITAFFGASTDYNDVTYMNFIVDDEDEAIEIILPYYFNEYTKEPDLN